VLRVVRALIDDHVGPGRHRRRPLRVEDRLGDARDHRLHHLDPVVGSARVTLNDFQKVCRSLLWNVAAPTTPSLTPWPVKPAAYSPLNS
jgi:hypothetical protein